ncbi:hypothetical protein [Acinetobacter pollinis]|uniref:hypothetical protein n=1 Tax=Acinetobacter pollinis TaxID=2605270 RepID=UPI0018C3181D|nr:hypothetical protein [Acinetobacter pollinis]MBF7694180.1 hypothetical protein [Acinetobacter pollinis]MBF7701745.1 hypothetical protein [Acinetobacter pollinis]
MKKILLVTILSVITTASFARGNGYSDYSSSYGSNSNSSTVSGYTRSNGTYVDSYQRTSPNNTQRDNYSSIGNTNPYTGKQGTHVPSY